MRLLPALLLGPVLALLPGCRSGAPQGGTPSNAFPAPNREIVYSAALQAMRAQDLTPDLENSSLGQGILVSRWRNSLQPFSHLGYRDMATIWVKDDPGGRNRYTVEVQVMRQRNKNMTQPGNPIAAEWSGSERVPELEGVILQTIRSHFATPNAGS
jgi:hypothetical protein